MCTSVCLLSSPHSGTVLVEWVEQAICMPATQRVTPLQALEFLAVNVDHQNQGMRREASACYKTWVRDYTPRIIPSPLRRVTGLVSLAYTLYEARDYRAETFNQVTCVYTLLSHTHTHTHTYAHNPLRTTDTGQAGRTGPVARMQRADSTSPRLYPGAAAAVLPLHCHVHRDPSVGSEARVSVHTSRVGVLPRVAPPPPSRLLT